MTPTKTQVDPWARHLELKAQAGVLRAAAEAVIEQATPVLRARVDAAYEFLAERFLPNALAEQEIRMHLALRDCRTAQIDRLAVEVERLTGHLGEVKARYAKAESEALRRDLCRTLYELTALVDLHYAI